MEKCSWIWGGGGEGLVVESGITFFIRRGLGDFPAGKSFWGVGGTSQGKTHSERSQGLSKGEIILGSLGDFPEGNAFREVSGTFQGGNHSEGSGGLPRGKLIPRCLRDFPRGKSWRGLGDFPRDGGGGIILRGLGDLSGENNHLLKVWSVWCSFTSPLNWVWKTYIILLKLKWYYME